LSTLLKRPPDSSSNTETTTSVCWRCGRQPRIVTYLNQGTGACINCAQALAFAIYSSPAARVWLWAWEARFKAAVQAADIIPDELLGQTDFLLR
jgi:hypothetical protein